MKTTKPNQLLYHGTCYKFSHSIEKEGIKPINYSKVYLTADISVAYEYAKQCSKNNDLSLTVICIVDAVQMYKDGYVFTHEVNNAEWTTDYVPSKYIIQVLPESEEELSRLVHYAQEQVAHE